jgi:hypothetical protein
LPNLSVVAEDVATDWERIMVANCYGGAERAVEVVSNTAIWYSTGLPAVALRWILIRDPQGKFETQALPCNELDADPKQIISWFVRRWRMEVTFQEMRRRLGFRTQRHWSELAVRRTAPVLLGLFSLVTLFAHQRMSEGADAVFNERPGTTSRTRLSPMPWRWGARSCDPGQGDFCGSSEETDTVRVPRSSWSG